MNNWRFNRFANDDYSNNNNNIDSTNNDIWKEMKVLKIRQKAKISINILTLMQG